MEEITEKEIVERIKQGEIDQFRFLVKIYSQKVRLFIRRKVSNGADTEDIVQNSFIKLYRAMDKFDSEKKVYPYLLSIASNEIAQFYRENPRYQQIAEEISALPIEEDENIWVNLPLKPVHKRIVGLLVAGYSYREIADKTGKPLNTVKTLIRRARIEVKELYEKTRT